MPVAAPALRAADSRKRKGRRWIVSETVSRGREAGQQAAGQHAEAAAAGGAGLAGRRRRRGGWAAAGLVVVLAAGAVWAWRAGVFSPAASSGAGQQGAPAPATAAVTRQDLSSQTPVSAT